MSYGEIMLIEKLEAENDYLRKCNVTLRQELAELKAKYEPELEYARDLGRCGI